MDLEERFCGSLIGLAVGDALGFPVEFLNRSQIEARYGPDGVTDLAPRQPHGVALYSDDTQMAIAVARALLAADASSLDDIMLHVREEFIAWLNSPENNRAPGQTCIEGSLRMEQGVHWFSSGDPWSKGCGAAMRTAPVGLLFNAHQDRLVEAARAISICTHAHPTGLSSAIAASKAVALMVNQHPVEELLDALQALLHTHRGTSDFGELVSLDPLNEQVEALSSVRDALGVDPREAFDILGAGWVGHEAVAGALYSFLRSPDDFRTTVLVAANASQTDETARGHGRCDSDSIACITGAIAGAYVGLHGIPTEWVRRIENGRLLLQLGRELARKAQSL